jgi:RNA polymerase sigma-70 factor (ECF subfamily)
VPGSDQSIAELYRQHGHLVLRRALGILGNADEAQDVLHDVFASLVHRPEQFAGRSAVTTWLYSATVHQCLNRIRDRNTRGRLLEAHAATVQPSAGGLDGESRAGLRRLLGRMPEELAQVAVYHAMDGMTQEEIADVMACSRRHVNRLLDRLQAWADQNEKVA